MINRPIKLKTEFWNSLVNGLNDYQRENYLHTMSQYGYIVKELEYEYIIKMNASNIHDWYFDKNNVILLPLNYNRLVKRA